MVYDGKTGNNKRFCQQCMCSIITPEEANSSKKMLSAKWIDHNGVAVAVSPTAKCVCMLSNPSRANEIESKGIQNKHEGNAFVEQNDYATYSMANAPPIPEYKIVLKKGKFNGIHTFYNICLDPNLGIGWVAVCCVACGCGPCKVKLKMPWTRQVNNCTQPCYAENKECLLWQSYEGANNWRIC